MNTKICPSCKSPVPANAPGGLCPACILRDADEPAPAGRTAPPLAEIASAFPQLEIESLIGQGGMGFVYKARQPSLDRVVALKILAPELSRDPAFAERFAREARVLGKLSHPNIVTIFEHGETGGFFYLLMEFVDGVNLRQAMRAGRFTPEQALAIVPSICDALQAAHSQGVWHRDIKPENILLDARGGVKIADFGIARIVGDPGRDFTLTATGAALGSAAYMAPEQHEKPHDVDHRADIYSLGVVIYEMLTGELPLGRFPAPSERAAVSARIDEIVFQTLEKERKLRQQSAAEVKTDVHRAAKSGIAPARESEPLGWTLRTSAQTAIIAGLVLFGAAVAVTGGSPQSVLLTFAMFLFAMGLLGVILFRRDGSTRVFWRRHARRVAVAALLIAGLCMGIYFLRDGQRERELLALQQAQIAEVQRIAKARAAAEKLERANAKPSFAPGKPATSPAYPKESPESVFRKLNAAANESNGDVIRKHGLGSSEVLKNIEQLQGEIVTLKATASATQRDYAKVFATLRKNDGSLRYMVCVFRPQDMGKEFEWMVQEPQDAYFRTACRVEFRPDKGDAATILRTHLGSAYWFRAVSGVPEQFDLLGESSKSDDAAAQANGHAENVAQSLARFGFGTFFKIIAPAQPPEKPWMAEDEPPFSPAQP